MFGFGFDIEFGKREEKPIEMKKSVSMLAAAKALRPVEDVDHNRLIIQELGSDIKQKYLKHKIRFEKLRSVYKVVVIASASLNSFGISALGSHFISDNPSQSALIIALSLNSVSFIMTSTSQAYQLSSKLSREKELAGSYWSLNRDIERKLASSDELTESSANLFLDQLMDKLALIEDYESTV
jgi:hypothetical protein